MDSPVEAAEALLFGTGGGVTITRADESRVDTDDVVTDDVDGATGADVWTGLATDVEVEVEVDVEVDVEVEVEVEVVDAQTAGMTAVTTVRVILNVYARSRFTQSS